MTDKELEEANGLQRHIMKLRQTLKTMEATRPLTDERPLINFATGKRLTETEVELRAPLVPMIFSRDEECEVSMGTYKAVMDAMIGDVRQQLATAEEMFAKL